MKQWARSASKLKWLRPGMGVKRWLLLLIAGFALIGFGIAALIIVFNASALQTLLARWLPRTLNPLAPILLVLLAGGILITFAIQGFGKSLLSGFRRANQNDVAEVVYRHRQRQRGPKVVAIGGGHGLNTLLRGLKEHTDNITAIVTVADDGGSSGRLRREMGMLPPGDFRNCIAALSDAEGLMTELFQYRFGTDSGLNGHSFGNLYLTAMTAITGGFETALDESSRVLAVRGRVIPSTLSQITLCADVLEPAAVAVPILPAGTTPDRTVVHQVRGESSITAARGAIQRVYLEPDDAPAYPEAIKAILNADLIVAGPGSLYTSVLPNLLVRDLARAIQAAQATKVYVANVATQAGETQGYDVTAHVRSLQQHLGPSLFVVVLANHNLRSTPPPGGGVDWVHLPQAGERVDYQLITRDLVDQAHPWRHDPTKLAQALMEFVQT